MTKSVLTGFPVSNTNIGVMIDHEVEYNVQNGSPAGKVINYLANSFKRNLTLEDNDELSGSRLSFDGVPGAQAPAGSLNGHMTDETIGLKLYAALGNLVTTAVPIPAPTATLAVATPGNVDNGAHLVKIVVKKPSGAAYSGSTASATVTVVDKTVTGRINVSFPALPTGYTRDVYMTEAAGSTYKLVTSAIAATVTSYVINLADSGLGATLSAGTLAMMSHVFTVGNTLSSFVVERSVPYAAGTKYYRAPGAVVNMLKMAAKSTGFFDINTDWHFNRFLAVSGSPYDGSPTDWRNGERLHHATLGAGLMLLNGAAFAKFQDMNFEHNNNLQPDFPISLAGYRGSSVPLRAISKFSGNMKVSAYTDLDLVADGNQFHALSAQWAFWAYGHSLTMSLPRVQVEPNDPEQNGQGISTLSFSGMAKKDPTTSQQVTFTLVNDVDPSKYETGLTAI